jgi:hypothetical protein
MPKQADPSDQTPFRELVPQEEVLGNFEGSINLSSADSLEIILGLGSKLTYIPSSLGDPGSDLYIAALTVRKKQRPTTRNPTPDPNQDISAEYHFNSPDLREIIETMYAVVFDSTTHRLLQLNSSAGKRELLKLALGIEENIKTHDIAYQRKAAEKAREAIVNHQVLEYNPERFMD